MGAVLDYAVTFAIVLAAALYVVWRIFLPVHVRTKIRHRLAGREAPCAPAAEQTGCAVGCSGCALAGPGDRHGAKR
ncbi:MAG: hypothetical protein H6891_07670 [Brucellaceae bacterium]|nr:hypothetical protein [Brucellaceae bacterium]